MTGETGIVEDSKRWGRKKRKDSQRLKIMESSELKKRNLVRAGAVRGELGLHTSVGGI